LVRNVLCSLETGGAESVNGGRSGCIWEASCEGGSSKLVRSFAIGDLYRKALAYERGRPGEERVRARAYVATADILDKLRVDP
jgi:hypothetical protein